MKTFSILVVCTDNLCRSPTAEEVIRQTAIKNGLAGRIQVASKATHDLNAEEPIDYHAQKHAMRRGYDLSNLRVRLVQPEDFEHFDLILVMEENNLLTLRMRCPPEHQHKLDYFTAYCSTPVEQDVPDPFYGKEDDFERMPDIAEDASDGLMRHVRAQVRH